MASTGAAKVALVRSHCSVHEGILVYRKSCEYMTCELHTCTQTQLQVDSILAKNE